jgi:hypothetical protein
MLFHSRDAPWSALSKGDLLASDTEQGDDTITRGPPQAQRRLSRIVVYRYQIRARILHATDMPISAKRHSGPYQGKRCGEDQWQYPWMFPKLATDELRRAPDGGLGG